MPQEPSAVDARASGNSLDCVGSEVDGRPEGHLSTKRARRMASAQEKGVAAISEMSSAIKGWVRSKIGCAGNLALNAGNDGPESEAAPPEHNIMSAKFNAYAILRRNSGGPGATVMAVGSPKQNHIDNATYKLLADWLQKDAEKAFGDGPGRIIPDQTSHDVEPVFRTSAHRPRRGSPQPLSVNDYQSPEDLTNVSPHGQRQVSVFEVLEGVKETDAEETEDDTLLQRIARNDEIYDVLSQGVGCRPSVSTNGATSCISAEDEVVTLIPQNQASLLKSTCSGSSYPALPRTT
jgi:hypothetical protein